MKKKMSASKTKGLREIGKHAAKMEATGNHDNKGRGKIARRLLGKAV